MKVNGFYLSRIDADEGKVFDWANLEEHQTEDENGNITINHLYAKTLFMSKADDIDNYVEIEEP